MRGDLGGYGSLRLDRRFRGIGEIKRASGTKDRKVFNSINSMLTQLYQKGQHTILREIAEGQVKPLVVYSLFQEGKLTSSLSTSQFHSLADAFTAHIESSQFSADTVKDYTAKFAKFNSDYPETSLQDLPLQLEKMRKLVIREGKGFVMFNRTRAMFQGMLRNTKGIGPDHPLYLALRSIKLLKSVPKKESGLSVAQFLTIREKFSTGTYAKMFDALCYTGMRKKEYFDNLFENKGDRIIIRGVKRAASDRIIPRLENIDTPYQTRGFELELKKIGKGMGINLHPHLTRKTFAMWMELANLPLTRRKLYLGHAGGLMESYTHQNVEQFLQEDTATLLTWYRGEVAKIGVAKKKVQRVNLSSIKKPK